MVVRVRYGKNIRGAISYNEQKVLSGKAELIVAGRFGCEVSTLSFSQKLKRFTLLNEKCVTSEYNAVHISLNFAHEDKLNNEALQLIARDYLQGIGFDKQPWLVYRHYDANHTHVHIVTTPVKANGKGINLHNLVKLKSEPTRKAIEEVYDLVKAQVNNKKDNNIELAVPRAVYGKTPTKQAITTVVNHVIESYRFTDLEQYNAVLRQFNVLADPGRKGSKMREAKGLQYFITDALGNKTGVPIKASSIYTNPGMNILEKKYSRNRLLKQSKNHFTKAVVGYALSKANTIKDLDELLQEKNIVIAYDKDQLPLFIDNRNKSVFSLNDLQIPVQAFSRLYRASPVNISFNTTLAQNLFADEFANAHVDSAFYKKKRKKKR